MVKTINTPDIGRYPYMGAGMYPWWNGHFSDILSLQQNSFGNHIDGRTTNSGQYVQIIDFFLH